MTNMISNAQAQTLIEKITDLQGVFKDNLNMTTGGPPASSFLSFPSRTELNLARIPAHVQSVDFGLTLLLNHKSKIYHRVRLTRADDDMDESLVAAVSSDGAKWVPDGMPTPLHFGYGSLGIKATGKPYLVSDFFVSQADAESIYGNTVDMSDTVDDAAFAKAVRYLRGQVVSAGFHKETPRHTVNNSGHVFGLHIPAGVFYLNKPLDLTNIRAFHKSWSLTADNAVILSSAVGKASIDLLGSRKCMISGTATVIGVWSGAGVPRIGLQLGRDISGNPADSHAFHGLWEFCGMYSLSSAYNYASEDVRWGNTAFKNDLDARRIHVNMQYSSGKFSIGDEVTWEAGGGVVTRSHIDKVTIIVETGSAPASGDQVSAQENGVVGQIYDDVTVEPLGEGPDGRSYCVVQDGDNYWGVTSDYLDVKPKNTPASFLKNVGVIDARHTGRGDAIWFSRAAMHDFDNSYFVSTDSDGGAGIVGFSNTSTDVLSGCSLRCHVETDGADQDASTGLDYAVRFDAPTLRAINIKSLHYHNRAVHAQIAVFSASAKISSLTLTGGICIDSLGRDVGQVMFDPPEKFNIRGCVTCLNHGLAPFFNLSELGSVAGSVLCADINDACTRHSTSSYLLTDLKGATIFNGSLEVTGNVNATAFVTDG